MSWFAPLLPSWVWLPHQCQAATHSGILYNILQLYTQEVYKAKWVLTKSSLSTSATHRITDEQTSARQRRTPHRRHPKCTDPSSLISLSRAVFNKVDPHRKRVLLLAL